MLSDPWKRRLAIAGIALCAGTVAGGLAGWYAAHASVDPQITGLERILRDQLNSFRFTPATSTVETVVIAPRVPEPSYPNAFLTRNVSPVLTLVRQLPSGKSVPGFVTADRVVGSAVSLTSDGWVVTNAPIFSSSHLADVAIVWHGRTYPLQQGIRDRATGAVFLKANITGLPVTNLVRSTNVLPGTISWVESIPGQIRPSMITDTSVRSTTTPAISSEVATRQFLLADLIPEANGGAVWNDRGELIGIVSHGHSEDLARVLPANNIIQALESLLADHEIRHATLGVRAIDLTNSVFDDARAPGNTGVWLTSLQPAVPAVLPQGPSAKTFQEGDIILRIERDNLDGGADLGERLLDYRPGSAVMIYGMRKGAAFQTLITLGSVVTSEVLK